MVICFLFSFSLMAVGGQLITDPGDPSDNGIQPKLVLVNNQNPCDDNTHTPLKVENFSSGTDFGQISSVYYEVYNKTTFSWVNTSDDVYVHAVYVKAGAGGGKNLFQNNLYTYSPDMQSDSGLHAAINPNSGKLYEISHIIFCLQKKEVGVNPGIAISKEVSPTTAKPGDQVEYTITVTNTGNVDLEDIQVSDTMLWDTPRVLESLAAGVSYVYKESYTIPAEQAAGALPNTASASTSYQGEPLADEAAAVLTVTDTETVNPGISVSKEVSPNTAKPGDQVEYTL